MPNNFFVHPTAVVDAGAVVGAGTRIWHCTHICATAVIGDGCNLGQNVYVDNNVRIGNRVKIQNNVSVYDGVVVEDYLFIGPLAAFANVVDQKSFIERKHEFLPTLVRCGASIGANATIICGNTIGCYAMVGAGAVVTVAVPDFALVYGNPARLQGWVSKAGHRLVFDENGLAVCAGTGAHYVLEHNVVQSMDK